MFIQGVWEIIQRITVIKMIIFLIIHYILNTIDHNILFTSSLMRSSLFPQSPPLWMGCLLEWNPPLGGLSLKGQRKLLASLKLAPTVWISLIRSSMQMMLCFLPRDCSMMELFESGILCP